jgi:Na+-transporting NADH:ubiquinone oxidoreductase subunit NqrD
MIPIVFALITGIFAYLFTKLENKNYKTFFFFLTLLFSILTFASFKGKVIQNCVTQGTNYCLAWETTYQIPALDAIIYGLGLVMVVFIMLWFLDIFLQAVKGWFV